MSVVAQLFGHVSRVLVFGAILYAGTGGKPPDTVLVIFIGTETSSKYTGKVRLGINRGFCSRRTVPWSWDSEKSKKWASIQKSMFETEEKAH